MNSPLRLYLMTRSKGLDWKIFVSQQIEDAVEEWLRQLGDGGLTGVIHVGFGRPAARSFNEVASDHVDRLLVTQGAKFVLPETFKCSKAKVANVGGLPVFLALEGWGYSIDDPTAGSAAEEAENSSLSAANNSTSVPVARGWVSQFLSVAPELAETLEQAGVHDEESYLDREGLLHGSLRTTLGQFRYDCLIRDASDPLEIVRCSPPWLRSLEVQRLSLTVRLGNVFNNNQIRLVSDLDQYSEADLFQLKNFGRHSKEHLVEALQDGLRRGAIALQMPLDFLGEGIDPSEASGGLGGATSDPSASISLGLIGSLLKSLNEIDERDRNIVLGRMGFWGSPRTLEDIGGEYGVTRERIRQIEKRAIERISAKELWDDVMRHRLNAILDSRKDPLPLFALEVLDDWFRGTASKEDMLAYLVDTVCEKRFHTIRIGAVRYLTRVDQETWNGKLREARQLLESAVDLNWTEAECLQTVKTFLPDWGKELAPILWAEASKLCHFSGSDEARTLTAYGRGTEQLVQVVLEDSPRPLHTSEIAQMVSEISGKAVEESQVRNPVANVGFLLGRGIYGIRKHVPLSDLEIEAVAEKASEIVAEHAYGRQWHASELVSELQEIDGSLSERLDKYGLNVALQLKSQLKYLGRLVWALPDVDGQLRVDLREAVIGVLDTAGRPLTTHEINERLSEFRGVNSTFQIWSRDPVIRVGRGLWGLNDRDVAVKRDQQPALIDKVYSALRWKGSGIHLEEVGEILGCESVMDPEAIFSIAAIDERIAVGVGRFAYLREWGEPRRITLKAALDRLAKQVPGPMSINDIKDWLEFFTERKIEKSIVSHALSSSGTQCLGDGIWQIKERLSGDEDEE
jgi:hypothetical protein